MEKNEIVAKILKKNLLDLGLKKEATVITGDINSFLKKDSYEKYEIIFLDPPFANSSYLQELRLIKQEKIYKKEHVIIIHRDRKTLEDLKDIFNPIIIKQYGRSKIIIGKFL